MYVVYTRDSIYQLRCLQRSKRSQFYPPTDNKQKHKVQILNVAWGFLKCCLLC